VRVAATVSGKLAAMRCERAWGTGSVLTAKRPLETKERDDKGLIALSLSLATSVAKVLFPFLLFVPEPEPAFCA